MRCDGPIEIGAGHVGRCLPIAAALNRRGVETEFVGDFAGTARWMLERQAVTVTRPIADTCGVDTRSWDAAVTDLYLDDQREVCDLASSIPVATVGESSTCPGRAIKLDFHAPADATPSQGRMSGPAFVPVDPGYAREGRVRHDLNRVLVLAGASPQFTDVTVSIARATAAAFPGVEILTTQAIARGLDEPVTALTAPVDLVTIAPLIDLAVIAAGHTAYELASAGIPLIAVALAENQRAVTDALQRLGAARVADGLDHDPLSELETAFAALRDPDARHALSATALGTFDGHGADRIADGLIAAWSLGESQSAAR